MPYRAFPVPFQYHSKGTGSGAALSHQLLNPFTFQFWLIIYDTTSVSCFLRLLSAVNYPRSLVEVTSRSCYPRLLRAINYRTHFLVSSSLRVPEFSASELRVQDLNRRMTARDRAPPIKKAKRTTRAPTALQAHSSENVSGRQCSLIEHWSVISSHLL